MCTRPAFYFKTTYLLTIDGLDRMISALSKALTRAERAGSYTNFEIAAHLGN